MRITVLCGGHGGALFVRALRDVVGPDDEVTAVVNTADDLWMHGLKVSPDLDTVMYTLGEGLDHGRGWGRRDETWSIGAELEAYGVEPRWFNLGDRDVATHLVRTEMLGAGYSLSDVTTALCARWRPGVRVLPMTDDRVETHVVVADPESPDGRRAVHFQEYWVRMRAGVPALAVVPVGLPQATPAPGVIDAVRAADLLVLAPSNPVVSVGPVLGVPGVGAAVRAAEAPVVGVSPIIDGAPVRGMADRMLAAIDVEVSAYGVGRHYGARTDGGLLDLWLVDVVDADLARRLEVEGLPSRAVPLWMSTPALAETLARDVLDAGRSLMR